MPSSTPDSQKSSVMPSPNPSIWSLPNAAPKGQSPQQLTVPQSEPSPFPLMVVAQHDFPGEGEDEIAFQKGEIIVVIAKDEGFGDGWWTGRNAQNQIGLFPQVYTAPYHPPTPPVSETAPLSPEKSDVKRTHSTKSEGVYSGLGIETEEVYVVDHPLDHADAAYSDVEEAIAELSIESSASSQVSPESTKYEASETLQQRPSGYSSEDEISKSSSSSKSSMLQQIRQWTPQEVAAFMVDRGFNNYASNFVRHEITGSILLELDLSMLKEVDIIPFGVRFGIMREIDGLRKLASPEEHSPSRNAKNNVGLPARSPSRTSAEESPDRYIRSPRQSRLSPFLSSNTTKPVHKRQSSYDPSTPRSATSPRPHSISHESPRLPNVNGSFQGHRSTQSTDSGFVGPMTPESMDNRNGKFGAAGRGRVDSSDSGLGHSRHASADTLIKSPTAAGHKRQSSSLVTVKPTAGTVIESPMSPINGTNGLVLPATRAETPTSKPTAKFLINPNSTRSPVTGGQENLANENGVRLVKSYSHLRRRSDSTASPTTPFDEKESNGSESDLHHHRSQLLKNLSAKDAVAQADFSGWLKKRTEKGSSVAGLAVGPSVGIVGGWKKRFFVLKGRRISYYHSDKDSKEKGVIDITAHRCQTTLATTNPSSSPTDAPSNGPTRKISLSGNSRFIFKLVPPAPGTSRAVTFTPQKTHIFSAENENEFRGWVEALMKANIGLDSSAPVISSSTVPLISLARAKEMKSRPPALDLADPHRPTPHNTTIANSLASYVINSDGGAKKTGNVTELEPKSPPLPTPPLAKKDGGIEAVSPFEMEMEKALGKVGKRDSGKTTETEKKQPLLELSIPIGLS